MNVGKSLIVHLGAERFLRLIIVAHVKLSCGRKAHVDAAVEAELGLHKVVVVADREDGSNNELRALGSGVELVPLVVLPPDWDACVQLENAEVVNECSLRRTIDTRLETAVERTVPEHAIEEVLVGHVGRSTGVDGLQLLQAQLVGDAIAHEGDVVDGHGRAEAVLHVEAPAQPFHSASPDGVSLGGLDVGGWSGVVVGPICLSVIQ